MADGRILLRPHEAAESLGISRARLYQLLATGEIESIKIGASRRVPTADLLRYVERLQGRGAATGTTEPVAAVA